MSNRRTARRVVFGVSILLAVLLIYSLSLPWVTAKTGIEPWVTEVGKASGMDIARGDVKFSDFPLVQEQSPMPLFALFGGILTLVIGVIGVLTAFRYLGIFVIVGGFLAIVGGVWAMGGIGQANIYIERSPEYLTVGEGAIDCFIAGFCVLVSGIVSNSLKPISPARVS